MARPRKITINCPNCGKNALVCTSSVKNGSLRIRYYRCRECAHRGVLVQGAQRAWWRDTRRIKAAQKRTGCL